MGLNSRDMEQIVELTSELVLKKIKTDGYFKNNVKMKNATVVSELADGETNINKNVDIKFPYDVVTISVPNKTGVDLNKGDLICLMYWVDLKNAVAIFKVD